MIPAAIYARFSSDLQDDRSIDDQIAVDRGYAKRNGYSVVAVYEDREISGSHFLARSGLQRLLADAAAGKFSAVICESLSRLARNQGDSHHIRDHLEFFGIKLITPSDGHVSPIVHGMRAIIDAQYLTDLKGMIRRGMEGRIREGRAAGGLQYGYDVLPPEEVSGHKKPLRGGRKINEGEAAIVRRIFARYLAGDSARTIAAALNAENIPAPRGRLWRANTISGNGQRGAGILQNELYAGSLVWNRVRMLRHPETRRRVSRPNPESEWKRVEVPHLAIISRETFDAAQNSKRARTKAHPRDRLPPRRILSGLIRCGACGLGMASCGKDRAGPRIRCSGVTECGSCGNTRRYYLIPIERAVVSGLKARLGSPAAIALYLKFVEEERRKMAGASSGVREKLESKLRSVEADIERAINLALKGLLREDEVASRLPTLRAERDRLEAELAALADDRPIILHPTTLDSYLADLERLDQVLNRRQADIGYESGPELRRMIERVTVIPAAAGSKPTVRVSGYLESLLEPRALQPFPPRSLSAGRLVAEEGFGASRRLRFSFEARAA